MRTFIATLVIQAALLCAFSTNTKALQFGEATLGTQVDTHNANYLNGSKITTGVSALITTSLSVYVGPSDSAPFNQYQLAIYTDSAGAPGSRIAFTSTGTLTANAWNTLPISVPLQAQTSYWLIYNNNGRTASVNNMRYHSGSAGSGVFSNGSVAPGTWPATFPSLSLTIARYSLYLTAELGSSPPSVTVTSPTTNQTVSGSVGLAADAFHPNGVAGVQFKIDGAPVGSEDTTLPYGVQWLTNSVADGTHQVSATLRGSNGSLTTSTSIPVIVANVGTSPADIGQWSAVQAWPLVAIHSTLLKNGKVLVWDEEYMSTTPRIWDPVTGTFSATPTLPFEIWCSGQIPLADGRILAAGGHLHDTNQGGIPQVHLYDPSSNAWTRAPDMAYARWYPSTTRLRDGRIAIVSGQITFGTFADAVEIYDPINNSIGILPNVTTPEIEDEEYPLNFLLPTGRVLVISPEHTPARILDVDATTWTALDPTPLRLGSAVQYLPGKILMAGGGASFSAASTASAAVIDTEAPTPLWRTVSPMLQGRYMHSMVLLPTGQVLVVGGSSIAYQQATSGPLETEAWSPATETWTRLASISVPRMYHSTALLLPDARVLVAGGGHNGAAPDHPSAQIFSPPYLFNGTRPVVTSVSTAISYGANFTIATPDASTIAKVSLIGLGAATHSTDVAQSFLPLSFTIATDQLIVTAPSDGRKAAPGFYMLFIVNAAGVPSISNIVALGGSVPNDTTPPTINSVSPSAGATNVPVSSTITAHFSEPLNGAFVTTATFELRTSTNNLVSSSVSYNPANATATLTPNAPLAFSSLYTARVLGGPFGVRDSAGNPMAGDFVWSFNTSSNLPELGLTTIGPSLDSYCSNHMNGSVFTTTSSPGTTLSMSVYTGTVDTLPANRSFQLAIYSDNAGRPGTLLAASASGMLTANAWNTLPVNASLSPNTRYWLLYNTNGRSSSVNNMFYVNSSNGKGVFSANSAPFGVWPTIFPAHVNTIAGYSIYATF